MAATKIKQTTSAFLSVARFVSLLFLVATALDGVNRYLFSIMGKPWIVYIPKFLAVFIVVWAIISSLLNKKITMLALSLIFIILFASLVGLYYIDNTKQVMFGIYMTIPIFLGYTMRADIELNYYRYRHVAVFILLITVVGLFMDFLFELPWVGLSYTVGDIERTASKAWRSFGYDRLAGFTRASTSAAAIIVLAAIYLIIVSKSLAIKLGGRARGCDCNCIDHVKRSDRRIPHHNAVSFHPQNTA